MPCSARLGAARRRPGVAAAHVRLGPPSSASRSSAYSRTVSSISKRPSAARERLWSTSVGEAVERARAAHRLGRLERPAADEHAEPREQRLASAVEQVVAPADRRAQRLLARGRVARPGAEQVEPALEPLEDRRRGEHLACARRRARSRAAARRAARRSARSRSLLALAEREPRVERARAAHEQLGRGRAARAAGSPARARPRGAARRGS